MAKSEVPFLVKHVALAIYESGDVWGSSPTQKITGAMDIARHRLVEYGFLQKGSEKGPVANIKLTPKGLPAERRHKYHGPKAKNDKFDKLYLLISGADAEESEAPSEDPPEDEVNTGHRSRKEKTQVRHAKAAQSAAGPKKAHRIPKRVKRAKKASAKGFRKR